MPNYDPIISSKYNNKKDDFSKNILDPYTFGINPQISDFSNAYINSYEPESTISSRPVFSYVSKNFLITELKPDTIKRPELSNITRAYLISQKPINENDEDN